MPQEKPISGMIKKSFIFLFGFLLFYLSTGVFAQHPGRDEWQQPERIMDSIGVDTGMVIGEPGAGDGYFTFKLAKRVGSAGKIYANDIVEGKLASLRRQSEVQGIKNITTILGEVEDPLFPDGNMDMIVMMYVFHDLEKPEIFLRNLISDLKPGGMLYLIERDPERFGATYRHFLSRDEMVRKVKAGGFRVTKIIDDFPRDNIYVCIPNSAEQ